MKGIHALNTLTTQSEFDAHKLSSKDEYATYYNMLLHALQQITAKYKTINLTAQEQEMLVRYIDFFTTTIQAFRVRYLHDDEHSLRLDVNNSGFPSFVEMRNMYNELLVKREDPANLSDTNALKQKVVDYICTQKVLVPQMIMKKISIAYYASTYKPEDIFYKGLMSKLFSTKNPEVPVNSYFISWATYDNTLNRPLIFFMYFTYSGKDIIKDTSDIQKVIRENADYLRELNVTASSIDKSLPYVHPKLLKCIDLGPFYSMFAKDEDSLATTIVEGIKNRTLPPYTYAIDVTIDILKSMGETEVKSGIFGNNHQVFQKYYVPTSNRRGATDTISYTFGSHLLLQHLNASKIDIGNYIPIPEIITETVNKQL